MFHVTAELIHVFIPEGFNAHIAERLGLICLFGFGCWT